MKTITIRGIDEELADAIREKSRKKQESMNQTVIKLLKEGVGLTKKNLFPEYTDLDSLAGTWTVEEEIVFMKHLEGFETIDEEMWD
ncbi:MAG TPA: antitoxin [bacterium]|nr:antitoxin [bacterium]